MSLQNVSHAIKIKLLRIIQETLVSILKHAAANKVWLSIYEGGDVIGLPVKDNGKGFQHIKMKVGKRERLSIVKTASA